jgi:hypothetical protein
MAGLLLLPSPAQSRSPSSGISVSIKTPTDLVVCTGFCPDLDVTVWKDGRVLGNRSGSFRVSSDVAAQFRNILLRFRPVDRHAHIDSSTVFPNACPVKVLWPADDKGVRPVGCGIFFTDTAGHLGGVAGAAMKALELIHIDTQGRRSV